MSSRRPGRGEAHRRSRALGALAAALALAAAARAEPPPEGRCPTLGGGAGDSVDASPRLLREGQLLAGSEVLALASLFPGELWAYREEFFHPGMRMQIGPCHRRYPVPEFYAAATRQFAGQARLDDAGNLANYTAGLPFPPETLDAAAPDAGARWAWNAAWRYRGAGPSGRFRIVDMPASLGGIQVYEGSFFFAQTAHRADLAGSAYALREIDGAAFVAGGRFTEPQDARYLAWTQLRPLAADSDPQQVDDTFVYVPSMRRIRRSATPWVDGMFTPRFLAAGDDGGGSLAMLGGGAYATGGGLPSGGASPTGVKSALTTEHLRRGFTDLTLRPNAYRWRLLGEREVLAPLNAVVAGYPWAPERNFGESGLSVASDRWDVRWAVVIEGLARGGSGPFQKLVLYLDHQTQQPLFFVTQLRNGRFVDVTIPVHRFSDDLLDYPEWPGGGNAYVFDPVAVVSHSALDGSGWRRESYDVRSLPLEGETLRHYTSSAYLLRSGR